MTSQTAVFIAVIFHFCLRFSIFITPEKLESKCVGSLPSFIILVGICIFLMDIQVFSTQYNRHNSATFLIIEAISSLIAIEASIILIWNRFEDLLVTLIKHILNRGDLYQEMGGDKFTTLILSGVSICFVLYAIEASKSRDKLARTVANLLNAMLGCYRKIKEMMSKPKSVKASIYHCKPVLQKSSARRNPCCPVHGDLEVNCGRR